MAIQIHKQKKEAFEYFLSTLHQWYKERNPNSTANDLSTLKVLKLLFFTCAAGTKTDSKNTLLDKVFNNFTAMPYGPVESDIYSIIKLKEFSNIKINTAGSEIINQNNDCLDINRKLIDEQVLLLKSINPNLINYSPFELVELSHKWYSWKKNYNKAKTANVFSKSIDIQEIKDEIKIFQ